MHIFDALCFNQRMSILSLFYNLYVFFEAIVYKCILGNL